MSLDAPNPWQEFSARATHIEQAVDALGDTAYRLVFDYVSSDDRLRLINESHEAIVTACSGLHALVRVAEQARELSRHLVVRDFKIATEAGNAPVDMEGTRDPHNPSQPAPVAHQQEDTA